MDEFKVPSTSRCSFVDETLSKERLVETPERPPVTASPGIWLDIGEIIEKELPKSKRNLEGWGSVSTERKPSIQETRHKRMLKGVGLKEKELKNIYDYPSEEMEKYLEKLTYWQIPVVRRIRRQFKNAKCAGATRNRREEELYLLRNTLEHKTVKRDELRAKYEQLEVMLQEVKAKKEKVIRSITEKNPRAFDPVNQGFCTMGEFLKWFHPGK